MESNTGTQQDEMEALQSIFMDEFILLNESPLTYELIILADPEDSAEEYGIKSRLRVEYPQEYPDVLPIISPHVQHPLTIKDLEKIKQISDEACNSMIGMPMIYEVSERIKTYLIERKKVTTKEMQEEQKAKAEFEKAEKDSKFKKTIRLDKEITTFTPVTLDNYKKWREKLDKENADNEKEDLIKLKGVPDKKSAGLAEEIEKGLSGRQFFEVRKLQLQKKAAEGKEPEGEDEEEKGKKEDVFYYDEEAFEDVGDVEDVDLS